MPSNDQTLDQFFAVFASGGSAANKVASLMALFCQDDNAAKPTIPAVGITHHGPNFVGVAQVAKLWKQFFDSFDPFTFAPARLTLPGYPNEQPAPRLYSKDDYPSADKPVHVIGVQTFLTGTFVKEWFQDHHASPPLSTICYPVGAAHRGPLQTTLPATAVFVFDAAAKITNLSIYLDRYRMMHELAPGAHEALVGFSKGINRAREVLAVVVSA
jgi:hypothetical protein